MSICKWPAALMLLVVASAVTAGPDACKTENILNDVHTVINSIRSYNVEITSQYNNIKSTSVVSGVVPDKMYVKQMLHNPTGIMSTTTVYDGIYQWVDISTPDSRQIYKIKLDKIVKPGRPFDTSFNLYGTGLLSGDDYPGTLNNLLGFYNLKASCTKGNVQLSGALNTVKFSEYANIKGNNNPDYIKKYSRSFGFIVFTVDAESNMIKSYSMGQDASKLSFVAYIDVKSINKKLDETTFSFVVPEGLIAADITDDLLSR